MVGKREKRERKREEKGRNQDCGGSVKITRGIAWLCGVSRVRWENKKRVEREERRSEDDGGEQLKKGKGSKGWKKGKEKERKGERERK